MSLPPHLKKKLQKLHLNRYKCSINHCTGTASHRWKGDMVCRKHYASCKSLYLQSWVVFIAQITQEVMLKMTFDKDERCILDPPSCLKGINFDLTVTHITNYIIDHYIPQWASGVVTKTLVSKGVIRGLLNIQKVR